MNKKSLVALAIAGVLSNPLMAQTISGTIVDKQGNPVKRAKITVNNEKRFVLTDDKGQFTITEVNPGDVQLHVVAKNYSHKNYQLTLASSGVSDVNIALSPTVFDVVKVNATPLHSSTVESVLPVTVVAGENLRMKQAATLGETLKNEVGVHSSYFGPVSSSPIIRGLDGPRVKITQNGLDTSDASRVGPDHAVASETSTATQVEVLRGPATLLYGSGAIGGVVNVVDNRVPHDDETSAEWTIEHNTVSNGNLAALNFNTATDDFAFHLDGLWRLDENFELAGPAELEMHDDHHDDHGDEHDDDHGDEHGDEHGENAKYLENTGSRQTGYTVGGSWLLDNGFIGLSYGQSNRTYNIPGHAHGGEEHDEHEGEGHEGEHEEESVYADMRQHRYQLISKLDFEDAFINSVHSKVAYTEYQHTEFENNVAGTTFKNDTFEGRFDLFHAEVDDWNGVFSVHFKDTDFSAAGEEAFTPPSKTEMFAISILEEKHFGDFLLQFGARLENVDISASDTYLNLGHHEDEHEGEHDDDHEGEDDHHDEHEGELVQFDDQSYSPVSASLGLIWNFTDGYNVSVSTSYSQRAPTAAEIFSFGPHIGTQSFDVGALYDMHYEEHDDDHEGEDDDHEGEDDHHEEHEEFHFDLVNTKLEMETSTNLDITLRKFEGDFGFVINAFYNEVDDFYYQQYTGEFMSFEHDHGDDHDDGHDDDHDDDHGDDDHGDDDHGDDDHGDEHEEEGLPIFLQRQTDVTMYGIEAEFIYQLNANTRISVFGDTVRAKKDSGGYLPRIPPLRVGFKYEYESDQYGGSLSFTRYAKQDKLDVGETRTDGYTMVDLSFNYYLDAGSFGDTTLYFKAQNLTDEHARVHSSFLKDRVPLPGRNLAFGIRGNF